MFWNFGDNVLSGVDTHHDVGATYFLAATRESICRVSFDLHVFVVKTELIYKL